MSKTANIYARIEPEVKKEAEEILATLGIRVSDAINIFYKQIILQGGLPFDVKIPKKEKTIELRKNDNWRGKWNYCRQLKRN